MDFQLEGKRAFVTAGAHGIGRAIADLLASEGASVVVADLDRAELEKRPAAWKGVVAADLATAEGVSAAVEYVLDTFRGAPDILVNNLGVADPTPFQQISDAQWARAFDVNLMGCVRVCRALLPLMPPNGTSAVVNIGSDLAQQPETVPMDYGVFKSGILHLTKALAMQYAPHVRVNAVSPGPIWTRLWSRPGGIADQLSQHYGVDNDEAIKRFLKDRYMPLGIGQPEDVAHAVVFLASPLARFITGANLDIGGTLRSLV
jgi:NAD(P)-dependent dehydrogenase (short-subunit alcohol dehydrogenase family)